MTRPILTLPIGFAPPVVDKVERSLDEDSQYRPELLLAEWPDALARASIDPVMAWKVQNV